MTLSQLESIRAARLQLLDHGDTKTASLLDWAVTAEPDGWRPISTAPKDRVFLGWVAAERWSSPDGEGSGISHDVSQGDFCWWRASMTEHDTGYFDNGAGQIGDAQDVTHWMPLPQPPAA